MKKFLSLILALVMVMSLSVTAFAEGEQSDTTTLTAEIPNAAEPSYTIHIPANMKLEYGNTGKQTIGNVYVTDVTGCDEVSVDIPYTDLVNTSDSTDTVPLTLYLSERELKKSGTTVAGNSSTGLYDKNEAGWYQYDLNGYATASCSAIVSDWSGATAGATYQAVLTFDFWTR